MSTTKQENPNTSSENDGKASLVFRCLPSLLSAIFLPVIGMLLLMLVNLIPNSQLLDNAKAASSQLCAASQRHEGKEISSPIKSKGESSPTWWTIMTHRDCFTDSIMVGVSISNSGQDIIDRALNTKFYTQDLREVIGNLGDPVLALYKQLRGNFEGLQEYDYSRYWHGYQLFLRPLLTVLDYRGIITLNIVVLNGLMLVLTIVLWRVLGKKMACCFALSMLAILAPYAPACLQFTDCLFIAYVASLFILSTRDWIGRDFMRAALLFFVVGAATSYFDFLTIPSLTLCIPLTVWLALQIQRHTASAPKVGILAASWFSGYVYMWVGKWILTCLLTTNNILAVVHDQIMLRSADIHHGSPFPVKDTLAKFMSPNVVCLVVVLLLFFVYLWLAQKRTCRQAEVKSLALVGLFPLVWCLLCMQHTFQHPHLTWRFVGGILFPYMCIIVHYTSPREMWCRLQALFQYRR